MFKINVKSLKKDPEEFSQEFTSQEIDLGADMEAVLAEKTLVVATVQHMGEEILVRGKIRSQVGLTCSRCLKEFKENLECKLMVMAVPAERLQAPKIQQDESPHGFTAEDAIQIPYSGEQFDLLPEIRSALILAIPMKPLCRPQCPGLCPGCARPLDQGTCNCGDGPADGPFSILNNIAR